VDALVNSDLNAGRAADSLLTFKINYPEKETATQEVITSNTTTANNINETTASVENKVATNTQQISLDKSNTSGSATQQEQVRHCVFLLF
jgi:hypothetical protein